MSTREQIDHILARRKIRAEDLKKRKHTLELIDRLLEHRQDLGSDEIRKEIAQVNERFEEGIRRFSRDYISIGTLGYEKQGKTRFLRSIAYPPLPMNKIPDFDTRFLTGARFTIHNRPGMPFMAVIHFMKKEKLLEIVSGLLDVINPDRRTQFDLDYDKLGTKAFDRILWSLEIDNTDPEQVLCHNHLLKLVEHFYKVKNLFGREMMILEDPYSPRFEEYFALDNGKSIHDPAYQTYYKYLAVEAIEVYFPFYADYGKLAFVSKFGYYDILDLDLVETECDAAIVVTKPIGGMTDPDLRYYNNLLDRFHSRDMQKWLFYLANRHQGVNDNAVYAFESQMNRAIDKGTFLIAFCKVADCSNPDSICKAFMDPLLEQLLNSIDEIDKTYMKEIDNLESELYRHCDSFV